MNNDVLDWLKQTGAPSSLIELHIRRTAQYRVYRDFYLTNMAIAPAVQAAIEATRHIPPSDQLRKQEAPDVQK